MKEKEHMKCGKEAEYLVRFSDMNHILGEHAALHCVLDESKGRDGLSRDCVNQSKEMKLLRFTYAS